MRDGLDEAGLQSELEGAWETIVHSINRQSSPGYPYRLNFQTNGSLFDQVEGYVKEEVFARVGKIYFSDGNFEHYQEDRKKWIDEGLRDPSRLFAKKQAQKKSKALPRLIANVSIVDQMVERIFFMSYADAEGEFYPELPNKKGIGFNREHAALIGERVFAVSETLNLEPVASDVSGWEKNFSQDLADAHASHMVDTCLNRSECEHTLTKACNWWSMSLLTTPYVTDEGCLVNFNNRRVQRSGDFLTTSSNGVGRGVCAEYVGSFSIQMGDDCLEWTEHSVDELKSRYLDIGLPVRDVESQSRDDFLFCSHRFKRQDDGSWHCWLDSWERMLYESSFSRLCDASTVHNYLAEIEDMPSGDDKTRIVAFLNSREVLLGAVAEHDKEEESDKDQHPGL